jgi:hypothetical protein
MTPLEIARRLTPAQKRALLWLPAGCGEVRSTAAHRTALSCTKSAGLSTRRLANTNTAMVGLTPLGAEVRAIIAQETQRDA